ncbi:MAG: DNA-3-methyladenine glycosylase family protein [Thermomicrobiales bacterium]
MTEATATIEFPLVGAGGEPVDLWRTINSHGIASLPPMAVDETARTLTVTTALTGIGPRTLTISAGQSGHGQVQAHELPPGAAPRDVALAAARHLLRLDQDLTPFYALAANDPDLAWAARGAGRMIRCATVFEDVVKTICTTNCTWSATERMVAALVANLGDPAPDAPADGAAGRAFPSPAAMAAADETFYRDVVRAGYRSRYLRELAQAVAAGTLDLEPLGQATPDDLPDDDLAKRLLALPGVGPYATAHIMMMLGRSSLLIFDSWTRPKYARLMGLESVTDADITARFALYGPYAGLAFWLFLTRDWIEEQVPVISSRSC